jgi:triosephosphate isomerase
MIAGNWKMHKTVTEAIELVLALKRELYDETDVDIVVCPPFTAISEVSELLSESNIKLGAQNVFWEEKGAYTGEISPQMLREAGCSFVIIGHSERREYFSETNEAVNRKTKAALVAGLTPIVCVGERLKEREKGITFDIVDGHLNGALAGLSGTDVSKIIIAYEPVWAIGTGRNATPQQAEEVHSFIRKRLRENYDSNLSQNVRILYGGSVKPDTITPPIKEEDIDGALVGGASLDLNSFVEIIKRCMVY